MSEGNKSYSDSAIVETLQYDTPICRRTLKYMLRDAIELSDDYSIEPREIDNVVVSGKAADVVLGSAIATTVDAVNKTIHIEVQARSLTDMGWRMFQYGIGLSRKYRQPDYYIFPYQTVQVLCPAPASPKEIRLDVRNFDNTKRWADYRVPVTFLDGSCEGTLLYPIYEAAITPAGSLDDKRRILLLNSVKTAASELEPRLARNYTSNILGALTQRYGKDGFIVTREEILEMYPWYDGLTPDEYVLAHPFPSPAMEKYKEMEKAKEQLDAAKREATDAKREATDAKREATDAKREANAANHAILTSLFAVIDQGLTAEDIKNFLKFDLNEYPEALRYYKQKHSGADKQSVTEMHLPDDK